MERPGCSGYSSFSYLNAPVGGKIKLKGAQTEGYVAKSSDTGSVTRYTPRQTKGAEYVAAYKAEEERKYLEKVRAKPDREDVTCDEAGQSQLLELDELTSVGTTPNLENLSQEQNTKVYQFYNFAPVEPEEHLRPIHNERKRILGLINANAVCVIKGPTGCGKSTQIPQFILDDYAEKKVYCNIVVTQPRRIAAVTIGEHICKQRNWELGQLVGYQVALDKKISEDTRLLYCTTGVLLEKLIADKDLNTFTHIILDEVHEREEDMDFVMLIVKKFLRSNSPRVKVILMSATLDVTRFAEYFQTVTKFNDLVNAPAFEIKPKKQFDVSVHYLGALKGVAVKLPPSFDIADPNCYEDLYALVSYMIESFNHIDDADFAMKKSSEQRAAVLIFLPGLYQIESLHEFLSKEDSIKKGLNLWLCPLHSSITRDEQEKVRKYPPKGKRKVILSTNIAESSITIPDVKYVIDFCLTKHLVADPDTGFSSLQLAWASHTNCIQREGRVGRVQDGRVYRLVPQHFYEDEMDKECLPEMQRCPLEAIVLKCKKLLPDTCPLQLISQALDPPDFSNYEKTILKLKEIGALLLTCRGELNPKDGDLTFVGMVMGSLPLDIHISKLILLGHVFDVLAETIIMGCAMSVRNIFSEPFKERMQSYNNKLIWADTSESDPISYLNVYQSWRQMTGSGRFLRTPNSEESWAKRFLLQIRHLKEVAKLEEDIKRRLRKFHIEPIVDRDKKYWTPNEKGLILKLVLAGAFYPHFFSRKPQNLSVEHDAVKLLSGRSPNNSVYVQGLPDPHVIYEKKLKTFLRAQNVGDDIEIYSDGSKKVIIEFKDHVNAKVQEFHGDSHTFQGKIPGDIKMAVYRAVKLKQLRIPITIESFNPNEVQRELERYQKSQANNHARVDYKPMIPLSHSTIEIEVSHVENAGRFYSHIVPTALESLKLIFKTLNETNHLQMFDGEPEIDTICAAPFKDQGDEYNYYRGKITSLSRTLQGITADIFFIDFGNSEKVNIENLRTIDEEQQDKLKNIAPQAIECVLAEVGPSLWSTQAGEWSPRASKFVTEQIYNQTLMAKVFSYVDGVASVYVYTRDNRRASDKDPPTLNNILIEKGFATKKQEGYLSKENHRKRREVQEQGFDPHADDTRSVCSLSSSLSQMALNAPRGYRLKTHLKGPFSPLEMRLFSMTHCSTQRSVQIEWSSVNSVLLDSDSSDPHERLVVAGSISQSADGNKLTLNHTTVMPNIHGLAALVCLLFCPTAELRVDESFSRYTGALCGLGFDPYDNKSVFPENDIEVPFDTEMDSEDLLNINKVRYWMNQRLATKEADDVADSRVIYIQNQVHDVVLALLKKNRPSVRVTYSRKAHTWGLLPNELLLLPYNHNEPIGFERFIYQLHHGVAVNQQNDFKEIQFLYKQLVELETYLRNKISPREFKCPLCDTNFDHSNLLLLHMDSSYHLDLRKWLLDRVVAHRLPRPEVFM